MPALFLQKGAGTLSAAHSQPEPFLQLIELAHDAVLGLQDLCQEIP